MEGPDPTTRPTPDRLERVLPQDIDAEMSLLGSMILESDVIPEVIQIMGRDGAERFCLSDHRALYDVLVTLYDASQPGDVRILSEELRRRGLLEQIGGVEYIAQLFESVPNATHAEHYARIVRDKSMLRDLIRASNQLTEMAYRQAEPAREILDQAEQKIFDVAGQRITGQAESLTDILKQIYGGLREQGDDFVSGLPTGYFELDNLTGGLQNGEMIVLAARPSMGKTALGLNMAESIAIDDNKPVAFFSMEQSAQQVAQRILCGRSRLDSSKLRRGGLSESEIAHLGNVCGELGDAPLYIDDTPGMSPLEVRSKSRRLHMKHKLAAIFIDYLQLMVPTKRSDSRQQEVADMSRALKALARELDLPVIVIAQLNRQATERAGHRPWMSDLRESGAIEQDADVVMLLHREAYYQDDPADEDRFKAELIIAKQRNGPTGTVELLWDASLTRFKPLSRGQSNSPVPEMTDSPF